MEKATFAAGCFWGVEAAFRQVEGVTATAVGYEGGHVPNATYKQVCAGDTGHAEVVQVEFDPAKVSYDQLLNVFWENHDPTTLNRQGPDVGTQYRSAIFYTNDEQKHVAEAYIKQLNDAKVFRSPIVTQVAPLEKFYTAEGYHQDYAVRNRSNPYIVNVSDPKVEKLKKLYPGCVRRKK